MNRVCASLIQMFRRPRMVRGFTMIELIVVLSLVIISSTVVMFNYQDARQGITLSATSLDVANIIRIAQVGGRNSSEANLDYNTTGEIGSAGGPNDTVRTGVYFNISGGAITKLTVYRGKNPAAGYQSGSDVDLEIKNLASSTITARLCVGTVNFTANTPCTSHGSSMAIEFSRLTSDPIMDSVFYAANQPNPMVIQLQSTAGSTTMYRYVVVEQTGNIFAR